MADRLIRSIIKWRVAGDYAENVFNWVFDDDSLNDWAAAIRLYNALIDVAIGTDHWISRLRLLSSNEAFISTISCRVFHPTGGNRYANQRYADSWAGAVSSAIYSSEIAMVLNFMSLTEESKMGRVFLPAVPISFVEAGRWSSAAVTAANNFLNVHVPGVSFGGTTFIPVIWRQSDTTWREIYDGYISPNVGQMSARGMGE